jgi:proline racemase
MLKSRFVDVAYTHTEGQLTCFVHSGIRWPAAGDILDKRRFLEERHADLKSALMDEPRGHPAMYGGFITPPSSPEFDAGIIWTDGHIYNDMCGHGTIALGMLMVAQGWVREGKDGRTTIRLETPAGLVTVEVASSAHTAEWTRFENVPAYVAEQDVPVDVPGYGTLKVDVAFGGNYFAIVKWDDPDLKIDPENGSRFQELGLLIKQQIDAKVTVRHPVKQHISYIDLITFWHEPTRPDALYRNVHVLSSGTMDRSPGGTGTSAMMAMFEARGRIKIGQPIQSEGLLGSGTFEGCLLRETKLGEHRAVVPTVKGKANILGYAKWLMDPSDPVGQGFVIR